VSPIPQNSYTKNWCPRQAPGNEADRPTITVEHSRGAKRKAPLEDDQARPAPRSSSQITTKPRPFQDKDGRWRASCTCVDGSGTKLSFTRWQDVTRHLGGGKHNTLEAGERTCSFGCGYVQVSAGPDAMKRHWGTARCRAWRRVYNMPDTRKASEVMGNGRSSEPR